jgi:hypothetical protein
MADDILSGSIESNPAPSSVSDNGRDDYRELVRKWRPGIVVAKATDEDLTEFVNTKLYLYCLYEMVDDNLWELFRHDFKDFTSRADFNRLDFVELQRLRKVLRCGGVRVQQNKGTTTIAHTLSAILREKEPYVWAQEDILEAEADLAKGPIRSAFITTIENKRL